jgi:hypothetical protein|tara:strand:+ start:414 stop:545 length:132 start_codon:yes stop_codon:yes gene_type:complete
MIYLLSNKDWMARFKPRLALAEAKKQGRGQIATAPFFLSSVLC